MAEEVQIGIIGFDTSHVPTFTRLLNDQEDEFHVPGGRVVAGYPSFSDDVEASYGRVEGFKEAVVRDWGVRLVSSVEELLDEVDAVLLESVDGRRHLAEAGPVIKARKPLFIDKPLAANYRDSAQIVRLAQDNGCPVFSSSSLRFDSNVVALKDDPDLGAILACDAFSPASLDPTNPGLFWYGVHGVELLYTFLGTGCGAVACHTTNSYDVVVGTWPEGRLGTMRGIRCGANDYGVTVFGDKQVGHTRYSREVPLYANLLREIIGFFRGAPPPVVLEETLEMMLFMEAALISAETGRQVRLDEVD
jgi:predicted dehydrogenase